MLYAVIIALWIGILLPMWLRRHDEALESRSVDRFSSAMRTLSGRSSVDRREVLMPARSAEPIHADGATRAVAEGRAVLAARRRRTLGVLLAVTLVLGGLAVLGVIPAWAPAPMVLLLVSFVTHLRRETRAQIALDRRRQAQRVAADSRRRRATAVPARQASHGARIVPTVPVETVPLEFIVAADLDRAGGVELVSEDEALVGAPYDSEGDRAWEPIPVPLPTYVTAPKAPRSVRVIDLTKPGLWTSGHLDPEEAERLVSEAIARGEDPETLDASGFMGAEPSPSAVRHEPSEGEGIVTGELVIQRRRAVNG